MRPGGRSLRIVWAIIAVAALTGCVGDEITSASLPEPPVGALAEDVTGSLPATLPGEAPTWSVGDAWGISNMDGEGYTVVVTRADADAYVLETTSESLAGYDAMFDVSYVGRIRASDLAGAQHGTPVQFFRFPMSDGLAWSTPWDGFDVALVAAAAPSIPTPLGAQPGFTIVGTVDGEPYVTYDYVPALRWWSHLDFASGYGFRVDRVSSNWTGALATAQSTMVFEGARELPLGGANTATFTVSEGQTNLALTIEGASSSYVRALALTDPTGAPHMTDTANAEAVPTGGADYYHHEQLPPTPGEWHISSPIAHEPEGWHIVRVHELQVGTKAFPE